jgi:hypothetical protein
MNNQIKWPYLLLVTAVIGLTGWSMWVWLNKSQPDTATKSAISSQNIEEINHAYVIIQKLTTSKAGQLIPTNSPLEVQPSKTLSPIIINIINASGKAGLATQVKTNLNSIEQITEIMVGNGPEQKETIMKIKAEFPIELKEQIKQIVRQYTSNQINEAILEENETNSMVIVLGTGL